MRSRYWLTCLIVIFMLFTVYGCSSEKKEKPMPDIEIRSEEINARFTVNALPEMNSFRIQDPVSVFVKISSDNTVVFPPGFGARIFIWQDDKWEEIENQFMVNPPGNVTISSNTNKYMDNSATAIFPKIADLKKQAFIRIVLTGHIVKNGEETNQETAAYVDVKLDP